MKKFLLFLALCCCLPGFSQPGSVDTTFNSDVINFGFGPLGGVQKSVLLPADRIAIIGDFQIYNGFDRYTLAIVNADGSLYHDFDPDLTPGDQVTAFFAQPDGKYLAAGNITHGGTRLRRVVRFNADGSFDSAFHYSLSTGFDANVECLTLLPDGKIIVGGTFANYETAAANGMVCLNADGTVDATFNSSGTGFNAGGHVLDSQTQPDGKVILVGSFATYNGTNRRNVLRINTNGSLDTGFTVGTGATMWTPGGSTANAVVYAVAMQSTGKILIGGDFEEYNGVATKYIARLNTNGTRDPFNVSTGSYGAQEQIGMVTCIRVMADDKVIMAGEIYLPDVANLIRLSANGTVESAFAPSSNVPIYAITTAEAQSDGKVVGFGAIEDATTAVRPLRRFNTDGSVDLSFNPINGTDTGPTGVISLSDDRILIGGPFYQYQEVPVYGMAALASNGDLDTSFHIPSGMEPVSAFAEQPDGKILISGQFGALDGHSASGLARLQPDGTVDTSFTSAISLNGGPIALHPDGKIIAGDFGNVLVRLEPNGAVDASFASPFTSANISAIALQPDGKVLVSGSLSTGAGTFHVARLNTDGSIDSSFSIGSGPNQPVAIAVQPDGKILIGGNFSAFNGNAANRILRLNADGSLDGSFDAGTGPNANIRQIIVQPDGKILVSGGFTTFDSTTQNRVARLLANGNVDTGFSVGAGPVFPTDVVMSLQNTGNIIAAGSFIRFGETSAMGIVRLVGDTPVSNTLTITGISPATSLCAGQNATVDFEATGTFESANSFIAELSDGSGNFSSAVEIGTSTGTNSGTINIEIPVGTSSGTGYKIRIKSSEPETVSDPSAGFAINAATAWYADADGDGYGDPVTTLSACAQPENFVADNTDCDDTSAFVHPAASEIPYNGIDDDCNGTIDDGSQLVSQVLPSQCGTTLSSLGALIQAVSYGAPVDGYRFKVIDNATLQQQIIDRTAPHVRLTQLANYDYAATYTVSIMLRRNGVWLNYYGPDCQISTPAILDPGGAGAINPAQCGTTIASMNTLVATTSLPGVTQYRFRVTNLTDPSGPDAVQTIDRNLHWFSMAMLGRYNYGTDYGVEVAVKTNGQFSAYGSSCTISTPAVPTLADCGAAISSPGQIVYTQSLPYVTTYRFELTNMSSGNFEMTIVDRPQNWFRFNAVPNFVPGAQYAVRVALQTSGSWSPFGESCTIMAPGAAKQVAYIEKKANSSAGFGVALYPNPYEDLFELKFDSAPDGYVKIVIYDMLGRAVASAQTRNEKTTWGEGLPSGVYTVVVRQGDTTKTLRVVKR